MTLALERLTPPEPGRDPGARRDPDAGPGIGSVRTWSSEDGRTVMALMGEHDISTIDATTDAFARAIGDDPNDVVLDLAELTFIDASSLHLLVRLDAYLRETSRVLTVVAAPTCARLLFDACGLFPPTEEG